MRGTRPVLVTFESFKDRDEILRKVSNNPLVSFSWMLLKYIGQNVEEGKYPCGGRSKQENKRK